MRPVFLVLFFSFIYFGTLYANVSLFSNGGSSDLKVAWLIRSVCKAACIEKWFPHKLVACIYSVVSVPKINLQRTEITSTALIAKNDEEELRRTQVCNITEAQNKEETLVTTAASSSEVTEVIFSIYRSSKCAVDLWACILPRPFATLNFMITFICLPFFVASFTVEQKFWRETLKKILLRFFKILEFVVVQFVLFILMGVLALEQVPSKTNRRLEFVAMKNKIFHHHQFSFFKKTKKLSTQ